MRETRLLLGGLLLGASLAIIDVTPAAADGCAQARQLFRQGARPDQIASALGAPLGAVQACLQTRVAPPGQVPGGAAGPAPLGAAGPPPRGAAGPAPLGAAGPAPLGAAGPPPVGRAAPPGGGVHRAP